MWTTHIIMISHIQFPGTIFKMHSMLIHFDFRVLFLVSSPGTMWPWTQPTSSNPSFHPPAAFPHQHVHHVTPPAPLHQVSPPGANPPTAYVGYQPTGAHFAASASPGGTGTSELSHSHPGIGYGIPGMVSSLSMPSPWSQEALSHVTSVISPHSTDPHSISPAAVPTYHSPHAHEELQAPSLSHLGGTNVSPTSYVGAPPPNAPAPDTPSPTLQQSAGGVPPVVQDHSGVPLVSPNPAYPPPPQPHQVHTVTPQQLEQPVPPQQQQQAHTGTPPQPHSLTSPQHHTYGGGASPSPGGSAVPPQAQHIHSSSPFSVDYLLRGNPPPNVVESLGASANQGGLPDGGHDPQGFVRSQSGYIASSGHDDMRQDITTGGWSLIIL